MAKTQEEHITDFKKIHGNKYDYSKVNYINNTTKIEIICLIHGSFFITPFNHKQGTICFKCLYNSKKNKYLQNSINDFKKIHGNKYDYSKVNYINNTTKIEIICPIHGSFWQTPNAHKKHGCKYCKSFCKKTQDEHINDFKKIHGNKYDYSGISFKNTITKIEILCNQCKKSFSQKPNDHKQGHGCPYCAIKIKESKGERKIREYLEEHCINYKQEYSFKNSSISRLRFDFYLVDLNILIEYDGQQHFEAVMIFGGEESFKKTLKNDILKNNFCLKNNIDLIRIKYSDYKYIENILKNNKIFLEKNG